MSHFLSFLSIYSSSLLFPSNFTSFIPSLIIPPLHQSIHKCWYIKYFMLLFGFFFCWLFIAFLFILAFVLSSCLLIITSCICNHWTMHVILFVCHYFHTHSLSTGRCLWRSDLRSDLSSFSLYLPCLWCHFLDLFLSHPNFSSSRSVNSDHDWVKRWDVFNVILNGNLLHM